MLRKDSKAPKPVNASRETEDAEEESLGEFIKEQMNKFFVDHIPIDSIKDLPNVCK